VWLARHMESKEFLIPLREILTGATAGAVGTVALNATTYADMVIRVRPSSGVPAQGTGKLVGKARLDLSGEGSDEQAVQNREGGLGALSGYVVGLVVGTAYGPIAPRLGDVSKLVAGAWPGLGAIAGSDVSAAAQGVAEPTKWGPSSWISGTIPHLRTARRRRSPTEPLPAREPGAGEGLSGGR
jgi:hypothetical protein